MARRNTLQRQLYRVGDHLAANPQRRWIAEVMRHGVELRDDRAVIRIEQVHEELVISAGGG